VLASAATPFVYGRQGGSPPSSFELLTVSALGEARYVAANPWPYEPPFDEVGVYSWQLDEAELEEVAGSMEYPSPACAPPTHDSGVEYVERWRAGKGEAVEWNPLATAPGDVSVVRMARDLIGQARRHPTSTLQASLIGPVGRGHGRHLALTATGTSPFVLASFGDGGTDLLVRVGAIPVNDEVVVSALPPRLVALQPAAISLADVNGEIRPGQTLTVPILVPGTWRGPGYVAALLEGRMSLVSPSGESYLQPLFVLPKPVPFAEAQRAASSAQTQRRIEVTGSPSPIRPWGS
jgi:hypothetical protein